MHYFAALCANANRFVSAEPFQLDEAETHYGQVLSQLSDRRLTARWNYLRLRKKARTGLQRVADARKGSYNFDWLP